MCGDGDVREERGKDGEIVEGEEGACRTLWVRADIGGAVDGRIAPVVIAGWVVEWRYYPVRTWTEDTARMMPMMCTSQKKEWREDGWEMVAGGGVALFCCCT